MSIGVALSTWRRKGTAFELKPLVIDVLALLQELNVAHVQIGQARVDVVSGEIAYSMSLILAELIRCLRCERARNEPVTKSVLEWAIEVVIHGWSQLLAGDIEDILQDVKDSGLWEV
jgi:hypothetical protein